MTSGAKARAVRAGAKIGAAVADGVMTARDLGNNPGNYMTPTILARAARAMAGSDMHIPPTHSPVQTLSKIRPNCSLSALW